MRYQFKVAYYALNIVTQAIEHWALINILVIILLLLTFGNLLFHTL